MYKPPSRDDEQPEHTQISYPRQRRRRAPPPSQRQVKYHSDEHPEIPKIRRASLGRNEAEEEEQASGPITRRDAKQHTTPKKLNQDESDESLRPEPQTANRIMVSQRRRHSVYQPPRDMYRTRPTPLTPLPQQRYSLQTRLQNLTHKQLVIGSLIIAMLILAPIVFNAIAHTIQYALTNSTLSGVTRGSNAPMSGNQPPADPHAIVITPQDTDHSAPPVFATSAYLLDADTGATLYAYNPFMHLPMLSTTKLMTAVLAVEEGNPDQQITITDAIDHDINQLSADSSLFGVKKGETYTLRDLLYGLLLMSGNDAAVAIADSLNGNIPAFVAKMNQRASQLGLYDTHYMNPHGLLETGHFSSAHDLAILGRYSMSLQLIHTITGTQIYHLPAGNHADRTIINGNQFLWWYPGVDGGKPGWDGAANFVQVISCTRNHHHLIGVVMHTNDWWTDMRDLMNWGFDSFAWISPYDVDFQHPIPYDTDWNFFSKDKKENTVPTADKGRYYIYTGYSVSGPILAYFDQGGGLNKFGYPTSLPTAPTASVISQQFEHATIQCDLTTKQCTTA